MATTELQDRQQQQQQQQQQQALLLDTLPNEAIGLIIKHACSDPGMLRSMSAVVGLYCELRV